MKKKAFRTIPRILRINSRSGYRVSCLFSNGENRIVDFKHLLEKVLKVTRGSFDYVLLEKEEEFAKFELKNKNIVWENIGIHSKDENGNPVFYPYELDPGFLYEHSKRDQGKSTDIALLIKNARLELGLTQSELAERSNTSKHYISRLENSRADIELLTLKRIVEGGLGRHLDISIK